MTINGKKGLCDRLGSHKPDGVYLLCGSEGYLISECAALILQTILPAHNTDMDLHRFEGDTLDLDGIYRAVEALPFVAGCTCVYISGLTPDSTDADRLGELCKIMADLPETTTLVLACRPSQAGAKPSAKQKQLMSAADKSGVAVQLDRLAAGGLALFAGEFAKSQGCILTASSAQYLIERCGDDMGTLRNEVAKLCAYVKSGEIRRIHIDLLVVPEIDAGIFDLGKAVSRGDYGGAMLLIDDLFERRESAVSILSALSSLFIDLYRASLAKGVGKRADEVAADFGYQARLDFKVKNAMRDTDKRDRSRLKAVIDLLATADLRLKSSRADDRVIVEQAVTQIFLLGGT